MQGNPLKANFISVQSELKLKSDQHKRRRRRRSSKMQAAAAAAVYFTSPLSTKNTTRMVVPRRSPKPLKTFLKPIAVAMTAAPDTSMIDYNSPISVFPMEACDVLGGEACNAKMYPEVKLATSRCSSSSSSTANSKGEEIEREYLEYNEPKTVFLGEACDDLGGEFCEAEYQLGVY